MLNLQFAPFPVIETERILLRKVRMRDAEVLFTLRSDVDAMKYIPRELPKTVEDSKKMIKKIFNMEKSSKGINWMIELKKEKLAIGYIGIYRINVEHHRGEIGYMILRKFWKNGYADEALKAIENHAFKHFNFHTLEADIDPENLASRKLVEKNNYILEAHFKENQFWKGEYLDSVIYSKINTNH